MVTWEGMRVKRRKVGDPWYPHLSSIIRRDSGWLREQWWRNMGMVPPSTITPSYPFNGRQRAKTVLHICIRWKSLQNWNVLATFIFSTCLPLLRLSTLPFPKGYIWNLLPKPSGSLVFDSENDGVCVVVATRGRPCEQSQGRNCEFGDHQDVPLCTPGTHSHSPPKQDSQSC